jgi:hypothetical protein
MVEVFKTDMDDCHQAALLVNQIHQTFPGYEANFDLDDCDKILRVSFTGGVIQTALIIVLLQNFGIVGELLIDEVPVGNALSNVQRVVLN